MRPIGRSSRSLARSAKLVLLVGLSALLACVIAMLGALIVWSYPGKPRPFVDPNGSALEGSIAEKIFVDINGVRQGMIVETRDARRPVLLYLHGGLPDYFLSKHYPTGFEDLFTVVWWEQRGAGISYSPDIPRASLTAEQFIADTLAVTDYLRQRFGQEKIYLMGHSGGTFFGIQAAARAPERYHAYIGVAQMVNQLESEKLAYEYMLEQFRARGNTEMVRQLEAVRVTRAGGTPAGYIALRDAAMHQLGVGTMHEMTDVLGGIVVPSLQAREYTLGEKVNLWRGKVSSGVSALWDEVIATDLLLTLPRVDLPVYFLHGSYDYTVSYPLAKGYFEALEAPIKGFYTFERSAHSPMFEEPERTVRILHEDVLRAAKGLADASARRT
jgi:pimeloyl-ACP methyl ester carboxylesterase